MRFPFLVVLAASSVHAAVTMPAIFGDHMVLQQDVSIPVWGRAEPGESVSVTLGAGTLAATAAPDGSWRVDFPPRPRNDTPQTMTVSGKNTLTFRDVLIGDVWVASGQSNMAFGILLDSRSAEALASGDQPRIRFFRVLPATAPQPGEALQGRWVVCTPQALREGGPSGFSAVAFYFAREIQRVTDRPVGLIGTYWGGTPAEAWTSLSGLAKEPAFRDYLQAHEKIIASYDEVSRDYPRLKAEYDAASKAWYNGPGKAYNQDTAAWQAASAQAAAEGRPAPPKPRAAVPKPSPPVPPDGGQMAPASLFNAMVAPLIPYAIKGVIWYQGEANGGAKKGPEYASLFSRLITDWREKWAQGDFPFLFVQIAAYGTPAKSPSEGGAPLVREGQLRALSLPATGMAVALDVGDPWDIHPKDKFDVGMRLARAARHVAYGEDIVFSGPIYRSMQIEGNKIRLSFSHVGGGLVVGAPPWTPPARPVKTSPDLTGFGIAGADRKWVWARAEISGNDVIVSSDGVPAPVAVRYGWGNSPSCNLYNREGLPASPFRTDSWDSAAPR